MGKDPGLKEVPASAVVLLLGVPPLLVGTTGPEMDPGSQSNEMHAGGWEGGNEPEGGNRWVENRTSGWIRSVAGVRGSVWPGGEPNWLPMLVSCCLAVSVTAPFCVFWGPKTGSSNLTPFLGAAHTHHPVPKPLAASQGGEW